MIQHKIIILFTLLFFSVMSFSQEKKGTIKVKKDNTSVNEGKVLFNKNCSMCHSESTNKVTGPGLAGATSRVPSIEWLIKYLQNSQELIALKDPYAIKMNYSHLSYPFLSNQQIKNIFAYIDSVNKK